MRTLLRLCEAVDWINTQFGKLASWAVLASCVVSATNAMSRYAFSISSNAWLEIQWYLFGIMFMLGASYTLKLNGHVRVDLFYSGLSPRQQMWLDLLGGVFFLLPTTVIIGWLSWPVFYNSWAIQEMSNNAGGLVRWPVKLLLPLGFLMLTLQGLSEIVKRIAALRGQYELAGKYEKPLQ